jgi:dihydrofolate reductase
MGISRSTLSLIVAMDENRVIGRAGGLPWQLPDDLKRFKQLTLGKTVLMGRKTWLSLGRPLPQRDNWVLSRDPSFAPAGARVFPRLDAALAAHAGGELMVIGGAELFAQTLADATRLYLTLVHARVAGGDTFFPPLDQGRWVESARIEHPADARHLYDFSFIDLVAQQ